MKRVILTLALCCAPVIASAAQTPVTNIGAFASPSTASINTLKAAVNTKLDVIELDRQDHVANIATKADKAQAVRYWGDHADGTTLASGTMVAHDGKIYHTKQNFLKTAGATPNTFTEYFEVAGGSNDYNSLSNRPTLGTASALNVGTAANNIVQLNSLGALPAVSGANLTNLPSASLPTWLPSVGPTADNQIIQATAAGSSSWTDVFDGLINDGGTGTDDLLSAAEIASRMTSKMAAPGPIGSVTPNTAAFTVVTAAVFDTSAPATGETGEIGLQEDPANGNNTITLKAPANLASDVILTLPAGVAPASAKATGTPGQWWYDANYWYVCIATNTWVRAPLATW